MRQIIEYMTVRQMVERYDFITNSTIRKLIAHDKQFQKKCVRRFATKILLIEKEVLKYIEDSNI